MVQLEIILDGTHEGSGPWDPNTAIHTQEPVTVIGMPNGTVAGRPIVLLRVKLPGDVDVFIETTLALFVGAARALAVHYYGSADLRPPQ